MKNLSSNNLKKEYPLVNSSQNIDQLKKVISKLDTDDFDPSHSNNNYSNLRKSLPMIIQRKSILKNDFFIFKENLNNLLTKLKNLGRSSEERKICEEKYLKVKNY